jgi:hypothetical protein
MDVVDAPADLRSNGCLVSTISDSYGRPTRFRLQVYSKPITCLKSGFMWPLTYSVERNAARGLRAGAGAESFLARIIHRSGASRLTPSRRRRHRPTGCNNGLTPKPSPSAWR